jgi:hypothetical protein
MQVVTVDARFEITETDTQCTHIPVPLIMTMVMCEATRPSIETHQYFACNVQHFQNIFIRKRKVGIIGSVALYDIFTYRGASIALKNQGQTSREEDGVGG